MDKIKCSVPILTMNSEKFLRRCLESVKDFEDVFLLDGNSTDATLAIAKEFGVPVYKQVETEEKNIKIADFSAVRIKSINLCKFDWVLWVDSDEFLTPELVEEVGQILQDNKREDVIYNIPKRYSVGEKRVEYSFNYPNYYPRLHNKKSGARFKEGKLVHEQMLVPANLNVINLNYWVYSELSPTYRDCVAKDDFQLNLMKKSTFSRSSFRGRGNSLEMCLIYFLRAVKIFLKSMLVYFRYGYRRSLSWGHVMRHVRVHLFMSYWRFLQFLFGEKSCRL